MRVEANGRGRDRHTSRPRSRRRRPADERGSRRSSGSCWRTFSRNTCTASGWRRTKPSNAPAGPTGPSWRSSPTRTSCARPSRPRPARAAGPGRRSCRPRRRSTPCGRRGGAGRGRAATTATPSCGLEMRPRRPACGPPAPTWTCPAPGAGGLERRPDHVEHGRLAGAGHPQDEFAAAPDVARAIAASVWPTVSGPPRSLLSGDGRLNRYSTRAPSVRRRPVQERRRWRPQRRLPTPARRPVPGPPPRRPGGRSRNPTSTRDRPDQLRRVLADKAGPTATRTSARVNTLRRRAASRQTSAANSSTPRAVKRSGGPGSRASSCTIAAERSSPRPAPPVPSPAPISSASGVNRLARRVVRAATWRARYVRSPPRPRRRRPRPLVSRTPLPPRPGCPRSATAQPARRSVIRLDRVAQLDRPAGPRHAAHQWRRGAGARATVVSAPSSRPARRASRPGSRPRRDRGGPDPRPGTSHAGTANTRPDVSTAHGPAPSTAEARSQSSR